MPGNARATSFWAGVIGAVSCGAAAGGVVISFTQSAAAGALVLLSLFISGGLWLLSTGLALSGRALETAAADEEEQNATEIVKSLTYSWLHGEPCPLCDEVEETTTTYDYNTDKIFNTCSECEGSWWALPATKERISRGTVPAEWTVSEQHD